MIDSQSSKILFLKLRGSADYSTKQIYSLLHPFLKKCGRSLPKLVTVSDKTRDERPFLLGFSSMPPRILLIASSTPPRFASKSEEALRRNRGINEVATRRTISVNEKLRAMSLSHVQLRKCRQCEKCRKCGVIWKRPGSQPKFEQTAEFIPLLASP